MVTNTSLPKQTEQEILLQIVTESDVTVEVLTPEAAGVEPNFDPGGFAFLLRMWAGAIDIDMTEIAQKLTDAGYPVSIKTVSRWCHGQMKYIPIELPYFLYKASGVPEGYWLGLEGMQVTETLGISLVVSKW